MIGTVSIKQYDWNGIYKTVWLEQYKTVWLEQYL